VGEKTKKLLLAHFKSLNQLKGKSVEDLKRIPGIGEKTARKILDYLKK